MYIACSTSIFREPLESSLPRIKAMGFDKVDMLAGHGKDHVCIESLEQNFDAETERIRGLLDQHGLTPVALNLALGHLYRREADEIAKRLARVDLAGRLMAALNIRVASFYPGYKVEDRPWQDVVQDMAASIDEMLEVGARHGATLTVELHYNTPVQTVEQGIRLLELAPALQVAYDPSHFAMQRITLADTALFFERTAHVHLRDAAPDAMQAHHGSGSVDFAWLLNALKARGYDQGLSIEYLPSKDDDFQPDVVKTRDAIQALIH